MKTFKKSMSIILAVLMLVSVMTVAAVSTSALDGYTFTVVGDASFLGAKWDPKTTADDMTLLEDDTYVKEYTGVAKSDCYTIKVAANHAWDESIGANGTADNLEFSVPEDNSTVKVVVDLTKPEKLFVYVNGEPAPGKVVPDVTTHYLTGDPAPAGWDQKAEANKMTLNEDGTYSFTVKGLEPKTYEYKVTTNGSWDPAYGQAGKLGPEENDKFVVETLSDVTFVFADEKVTVTIVPVGTEPSTTEPAESDVAETTAPAESDVAETTAPAESDVAETTAPAESDVAETTTPVATDVAETTTPAATTEPSTTEPSTTEPSTTEPSTTEPSTTAPSTTEAPAPKSAYYVVGSPELFGANWGDTLLPQNSMTKGDDGLYSLTLTNVAAGTYNFKVVDNASGTITWHPDGMGNDGTVTVEADGSTVTFVYDVNQPAAVVGVNEIPTYPTTTEPATTEPATTEAPTTQPQPTVCKHSHTKTTTTAATYFAKGKAVVTCTACNKVLKTTTIAKKVLKTPSVTIKGAKKSIKVTLKKKVKDATGFIVQYKEKGKKKVVTRKYKTNKKVTKVIKKLKKNKKYTVQVRAYVQKGKKIAYSKWKTVKNVKTK